MVKQIQQFTSIHQLQSYLSNTKICLFGIAISSTALHLILTDRILRDSNALTVNFLCWAGLLYLLWQKQSKLKLESDLFSSICGLLLLFAVFSKSLFLFWFESEFLKFIPLLIGIGLALLASGIKGIYQYWKEFIIILVISIPSTLINANQIDNFLGIAILTAKFTNSVLWYLGFDSYRNGVYVGIPSGSVFIHHACTGLAATVLLLKLVILMILVFKITWLQKVKLIILAVVTGFLSGGIRVVIMTLVVSDKAAFEYWHGDSGASIFSTIAIVTFGLLCQWILKPTAIENNNPSV